jgi:hypothetical protein
MEGKLVLTEVGKSNEEKISTSNLAIGNYIVKVTANTSIGYSKILKQ